MATVGGGWRRCSACWRRPDAAKPEYTYVSNTDDRPISRSRVDGPRSTASPSTTTSPRALRHRTRLGQPRPAGPDRSGRPPTTRPRSRPAPSTWSPSIRRHQPVAYSLVLQLPEPCGPVSLDYLRNIFLPVTETARRQTAASRPASGLTGFELLQRRGAHPGRRRPRGPRRLQLPAPGGVVHTFDLTAYANNDSSVLYLLLIRCTARCYRERAARAQRHRHVVHREEPAMSLAPHGARRGPAPAGPGTREPRTGRPGRS